MTRTYVLRNVQEERRQNSSRHSRERVSASALLAMAVALQSPAGAAPDAIGTSPDACSQGGACSPQSFASLSWPERERLAEGVADDIQEAMAQVERRMNDARRNRDSVYLGCLTEHYNTLRVLARLVGTSRIVMHDAIASAQFPRAEHELSKILMSGARAQGVAEQLDACRSQDGTQVAQTGEALVEALEGADEPAGGDDDYFLPPPDLEPDPGWPACD